MTAPLAGIRILDFTELLPGPFLTQCLVELGAEVVKVERPPAGDPVRRSSPGLFRAVNRGKSSTVIDLKSKSGVAEALQLLETSDVLVEGFRPGVMDRLGLGYRAASSRNPRLVYLSMSGYGQTGPLTQAPGHDLNYLAQAGIISLCGRPEGPPAHAFGLPVADLGGSVYGLAAVLAALFQRERTGRGQHLDLSLTDCLTHWLNARRGPFNHAQIDDLSTQRRHALTRPAYGVFLCRDGAITIAALETHFWRALVGYLGLTAFRGPEYDDLKRRSAECEAINAAIAEALAPVSRDDAVARMLAADIPVAPVLTLREAETSEHFIARALLSATSAGRLVRFPVRLDGMQEAPVAAPELGNRSAVPRVQDNQTKREDKTCARA